MAETWTCYVCGTSGLDYTDDHVDCVDKVRANISRIRAELEKASQRPHEIAAMIRQRANALSEPSNSDDVKKRNAPAIRELLEIARRIDGDEVPEYCEQGVYEHEISITRAALETAGRRMENMSRYIHYLRDLLGWEDDLEDPDWERLPDFDKQPSGDRQKSDSPYAGELLDKDDDDGQ